MRRVVYLGGPDFRMFEPKTIVPKPDRTLLPAPRSEGSAEPKQRRMMVIALTLLLVALGFVLFNDRDFWFPDSQEAQELEGSPTRSTPNSAGSAPGMVAKVSPPAADSRHYASATPKPQPRDSVAAAPDAPAAAIQRTVLPPLEVEVVAGDVHRTIHPGTNSIRVDLQPTASPQSVSDAPNTSPPPEAAASLTQASEHVEMSADASEIISRSVRPGYPMLARQMKVQGSVILQALISRDGAIQDLHVMSGPPILAGAAREAVRQWRFKPHYLGAETVETQAKITVNFTISTN